MANQLQSLQEGKLMALHQMVQRFAEIVDRVTWVTPEAPQDDDAVNAVAMLYHNKAHGKCMHAYMHSQTSFVCLFIVLYFFCSPIHPLIHPSTHPSVQAFITCICLWSGLYSRRILLIARKSGCAVTLTLCHALKFCMTASECCCSARLAESRLITAHQVGGDTACLPVLFRPIFVVQKLIFTDYQLTVDTCPCPQTLTTCRI